MRILIPNSSAGISLESPVVTSCGTGVTACVIALVSLSLSFIFLIYFYSISTKQSKMNDKMIK